MNDLTRRNVLVLGGALVWSSASEAEEATTGSIEFQILSAGLVVGVGGGQGVLNFRGKHYPLSVGGISAGAQMGASKTDLVGTASNLHDARDIEGVYSAVSAGVSVAAGASVVELSNARGVVLKLKGREMGFRIGFDMSGLTIAMK